MTETQRVPESNPVVHRALSDLEAARKSVHGYLREQEDLERRAVMAKSSAENQIERQKGILWALQLLGHGEEAERIIAQVDSEAALEKAREATRRRRAEGL